MVPSTREDDPISREMWHDIFEAGALVGATLLMILLVTILGRL
jgi:hypothetical protein